MNRRLRFTDESTPWIVGLFLMIKDKVVADVWLMRSAYASFHLVLYV